MCVRVFSHQVFDAAEHRRGQYAGEEGHEVQHDEEPDQHVQSENFLAAPHTHVLVVVAEVIATAEQDNTFYHASFQS